MKQTGKQKATSIAILGGGSWGIALAIHCAKRHPVKVWEFVEQRANELQQIRHCSLLHTTLPENITVSSRMEEVISGSDMIIIVVPSDKVESTVQTAAPFIEQQPLIIGSKGFASGLSLLSDAVHAICPDNALYCLYGPTHAEEVCKGMFSGIVLAGNKNLAKIRQVLQDKDFHIDVSKDIIGVQIAAALKNILAIMVGALVGKGLGDNAKAYVMTNGLAEIQQVGIAFGATAKTFYGLAGMGDVIVTCTSTHSRNFTLGKALGEGRKLDEILAGMKMISEGVTTAKLIPELKAKCKLPLPLLSGAYDIIFNGKDIQQILRELP